MSNLSPKEMLAWAVKMFGAVALNRDERAARVLEEALELAQCEGVSKEVCAKLVERVYSRPIGTVVQEIAGLQFCVNTLAENIGINPITEAEIEFMRVSQWPKEYWKRKHGEKIEAGVADLSPAKECICETHGHPIEAPWLHDFACPMYVKRTSTSKNHPSHVIRSSDASTFDEICENCGSTDRTADSTHALTQPCPSAKPVEKWPPLEIKDLCTGDPFPTVEFTVGEEVTKVAHALRIPPRLLACGTYCRPEGIMGGPCLYCGRPQPEHVKAAEQRKEYLPPESREDE